MRLRHSCFAVRPSRLAVAALLVLAACAPKDIARSSCTNSISSTVDAMSCSVGAQVVGRASSMTFDTESRNQIAEVSIALKVEKGRLRVDYYDLAGAQHVLVTPEEPVNLAMKTRLNRDTRSFTLMFAPVDGIVEGLSGSVQYSTP
jgi:hypothetical protein